MISHRTSGLHGLFVLTQIAVALGIYAAFVLAFSTWHSLVALDRYTVYGGIVALALCIEFFNRDRPTIRTCLFERSLLKLHRIALTQTLWTLGALTLFLVLLKDTILSRVFLATFLSALYTMLILTNKWLPPFLAATIFRGKREHRTLLLGSAEKLPIVTPWLERKEIFGFKAVGILCGEKAQLSSTDLDILGTPDEIERVVLEFNISQVIVLGLPDALAAYYHLTSVCDRQGIRLMVLSDLEERLQHPAIHVEDDGLHFIIQRQEPLESPLNRILKRLLDVSVALVVVTLILPFACLAVWAMQKIQSKGPLFYRQVRAGIQNIPFSIIKFRTMRNGDHDVTCQAQLNDDRVFPFGRFLRKYSIDELPQFLNVLRGEMSVVGPRPHLVEHNDQFTKLMVNYKIRAFIRPGITGLAQVRGFRGEATSIEAISARLESDTTYLENWSLFLDFGILVRTAWQMLHPPKTAY